MVPNRLGRLLCMAVALCAGLVASSQHALAGYVINQYDTIKVSNGPGGGNGGEFKVDHLGDSTSTDDFRTFCVQVKQFLSFGETLGVADVAQVTEGLSRYNAVADTQLLTARASALYREFLRGQSGAGVNDVKLFLGAYTTGITYKHNASTDGPPDDGRALQEAIWYYQNQLMAISPANLTSLIASNKYVKAVEALATAKGWADGLLAASMTAAQGSVLYGGVDILQIRRNQVGAIGAGGAGLSTQEGQDLLAFSGTDGFSEVPEPSTMVLFGIGFVGAELFRRRRAATSRAV